MAAKKTCMRCGVEDLVWLNVGDKWVLSPDGRHIHRCGARPEALTLPQRLKNLELTAEEIAKDLRLSDILTVGQLLARCICKGAVCDKCQWVRDEIEKEVEHLQNLIRS